MKKNLKRIISVFLMITMMVSICPYIKDVSADEFSDNEDKYLKMCSSSNITNSNKSTCESFNSYLQKKNAQLKKDIQSQTTEANNTKSSLDSVSSQITTLETQISEKQKEIDYIQTSIDNLNASIKVKEDEVKTRMYSQQSYNNSNTYIDYIFGSKNFADFFSRISSINEITEYDDDLINQLAEEKKQVEQQQNTIKTAKTNLDSQKEQQVALQTQYNNLYAAQTANLNSAKASQAELNKASSSVNNALSSFYEAAAGSSSSGNISVSGDSALGQAIANKALSKRGCRYYWGATGPNYFDCSGLVYWAFNAAGKSIPRLTAAGYAGQGQSVSRNQLQAGDIVTFSWNGSTIAHIGIMINNSTFVHASGKGSGTVGQYADQCVKTQSLTGYYLANVHNYRRMY
ncbi:MAG: NlpC/P60 family protein [Thomasclavelia sp.]|nr:NlpC/P60 family protein [Thomasclavelia sp.]